MTTNRTEWVYPQAPELNQQAEELMSQAPEYPEDDVLPHQRMSVETPRIPKAHGNKPIPEISPELAKHIEQETTRARVPNLPPSIDVYPEEGIKPEPLVYTPTSITDKVSVALPSGFAFYKFKDLYVGKLKLSHFSKLYEAHITRSLSALGEVVSSLLATSDPEANQRPLAFDLTLPDYFWVLYYLRASQLKVNMHHQSACENPEHVAKVNQGLLKPESLIINQNVDTTALQVRMLKGVPDLSKYPMPDGITLRPTLLRDAVECSEHPLYLSTPSARYSFRLASLITINDNPNASIEERIDYLEQHATVETINTLNRYKDVTNLYGVDEYINTTCGECGHQERVKISIDAHSFLSV